MKTTLLAVALFGIAFTASAFNPVSVNPPKAYDVIPIEKDPYIQQEFLGTLEGYPEMYEFTTDVGFDLKVRLRQLESDSPEPLNIIIVKNDTEKGGVVEVARLNQSTDNWIEVSDSLLAMKFIESRTISLSIPPGTYKIEVSTPDNKGDYMLVIGDEEQQVGYFSTLGAIRETQSHFGYSIFRFFLSPRVYYPIGILVVLGGIYYTHRRRNELV